MLFSSLFNEGGKKTANQQVQHFFSVSQFQATTVRQLFLRQGYIQIFFCQLCAFLGGVTVAEVKWSKMKRSEVKWKCWLFFIYSVSSNGLFSQQPLTLSIIC